MGRDSYTVTVIHDGGRWVATVTDTGVTEAETAAELDDMVRDLIVVMHELADPYSFDLSWRYDVTPLEGMLLVAAGLPPGQGEHPAERNDPGNGTDVTCWP